MGEKEEEETPLEQSTRTWLDAAPRYLEFYVRSLWKPADALTGLATPGRVSAQLTTMLLAGLALSHLLVWTFHTDALEEDTGNVVSFVRRLDMQTLPAVVTFATALLAMPLHGLAELKESSARSAEDTVNAAVAWLSVALPTATAFVLAIAHGLPGWAYIVLAIFFAFFGKRRLGQCLEALTPGPAPSA